MGATVFQEICLQAAVAAAATVVCSVMVVRVAAVAKPTAIWPLPLGAMAVPVEMVVHWQAMAATVGLAAQDQSQFRLTSFQVVPNLALVLVDGEVMHRPVLQAMVVLAVMH